MVVETKLSTLNAIKPRKPFNLPLAGMVVETDRVWVVEPEQKPFNPPLAGMVVETVNCSRILRNSMRTFNPRLAGMVVETCSITLGSSNSTSFQPTPSWDGC